MAAQANTSTTKIAKPYPSPPPDVPSLVMPVAIPDSEKTTKSEQTHLNVPQTKEIHSEKPEILKPDHEPKNSDHSDHSDLTPDDIPIPE